ncbi:MAG: ATP-binding protein [bacterium]
MSPAPRHAMPYADDAEHLRAALEWLDALLRARVARVRAALGGDPWLRGMHVDDDTVDALLSHPPLAPAWSMAPVDVAAEQAVEGARASLAARVAASGAAGRRLRLPALAERLGLDALDQGALLLALAPELDGRYERLIGWLHDDLTRRRPTVGLAIDLFGGPLAARLEARRRFGPAGRLVASGLLTVGAGDGPWARVLRPAAGLVAWVAGEAPLDPAVAAVRRDDGAGVVPPGLAEHAARIEAAVRAGERRAVAVSGPAGAGRQAFARALAGAIDRPLYVLDGAALVEADEAGFAAAVAAARVAALLDEAALCVRRLDALDAERHPARHAAVVAALAEGPARVVVTGEAPWHPAAPPPGLPPVEQAVITLPAVAGRELLWRRWLPDGMAADEIEAIADAFCFPAARIRAAAATAVGFARAAGAARPSGEALHRAARAHATPRLGALAGTVTTGHDWGDLVLAPDRRAQLLEIVGRMKHRTRVVERWGFGPKVAGARGTTALFVGPPGTGKTLAAALIAGETRRDLYRIDLSQVVSKYIGETEKHLERVFAEAEACDAALFFDEADALFGKRGEVKDAHDRYANIEVGYLLQRLERFPGLVILATNLRRNIDDAFLRRIDVIVEFPLPDVAERARIWAGVWPAAAPVADDIDAEDLAQRFDLAGGHIRNIALAAAFAAAAEGSSIGLAHVLTAARSEYRKLNRLVDARRFAGGER